MTVTLDDFCRDLLENELLRDTLDPEGLAAAFADYFGLSGRPTVAGLTALLRNAGFGTVSARQLDGLKGVHFGAPRGEYDIYYREDLWHGAKAHTVLHEAYEIIHETLCALHSDDPPERSVCREADRFAAAVLMPPETFTAYALASGLDVVALQGVFQCSYSSVAMRMAEVMRQQPLAVLLYERKDKGDPSGWPAQVNFESLKATVVKRTPGFGPPGSPLLCGWEGGIPRRGKAVPSDSLAELAARSGGAEYGEDDGFAVATKPVLWKGRIAKVSVVAVPFPDRAVLAPQLSGVNRHYQKPHAPTRLMSAAH